MRRIAALVVVLASGALLSACGASSRSAQSPKAVRASMVAAALAQNSVHFSESVGAPMIEANQYSADVTRDAGVERIRTHPGRVEVRLVNHIVYVEGDSFGLRILPLTTAHTRRYAGQWISIPRGDKLYAQMADGLTLASIVDDITPQAARFGKLEVSYGPTGANGPTGLQGPTGAGGLVESGGTRPYALLNAGPTGAYVWLRPSGQLLPVAFDEGCPDICWHTVTFSRWNEPLHVEAPASSTPIATVRS